MGILAHRDLCVLCTDAHEVGPIRLISTPADGLRPITTHTGQITHVRNRQSNFPSTTKHTCFAKAFLCEPSSFLYFCFIATTRVRRFSSQRNKRFFPFKRFDPDDASPFTIRISVEYTVFITRYFLADPVACTVHAMKTQFFLRLETS